MKIEAVEELTHRMILHIAKLSLSMVKYIKRIPLTDASYRNK